MTVMPGGTSWRRKPSLRSLHLGGTGSCDADRFLAVLSLELREDGFQQGLDKLFNFSLF
jgi:hypothetical protein